METKESEGEKASDWPSHLVVKLGKTFGILESLTFPSGVRDVSWLQRADEVRKTSASFWAQARTLHRWHLSLESGEYNEEDKESELSLLSFDQAPEHLATLQAERDAILSPKTRSTLDKSEYTTPEWDSNPPTEKISLATFELAQAKIRPKSRPETVSSTTTLSSAQQYVGCPTTTTQLAPIPLHDPIMVKPETHRVLTRLYPTTATDYSAKPLDWRTFVVAMEDVGFLATQSGGSAVAFIKEGEGRIVLHKPHPVAKIEQIWLQSWGKRMRKWFGWDREVFVCVKEEKKEAKDEVRGA